MTKSPTDIHTLPNSELLRLDQQHIWHPYAQLNHPDPMYIVQSAQGSQLQFKTGETVIDGMSSWWSAIHGYNHPKLNQALVEQSQKMAHVMFGGLTHEPAIKLAKQLVDITADNLQHVFFADSGSVAVEVAIKMALQYWQSSSHPAKNRFLSFYHGYHGDTFAAMSVCDPINGMHHLFDRFLPKQLFADAPPAGLQTAVPQEVMNTLRRMFEEHSHEMAAVIIEPIVQGAGGMRVYSQFFLKLLRQLCNEFDVLLVCDEIATGFGRTGKLFATEHADISPDILCLGKAISGGYMSFAATLCSEEVGRVICAGESKVLMHGPTFMGNPLACAVSNASIETLLQSNWSQNIARIERALLTGLGPLQELDHVASVRGIGAIGVVELTQPVNMTKISRALIDRGVWLRPFGRLVYTMPTYIINDEELRTLIDTMVEVISDRDIF